MLSSASKLTRLKKFKIGTHSFFTVVVPAVTIKPVCFSDPTKKTLLLRITMNKNMNLNYFFVFRFFFVTICVSLLPKVNIPKIVSDMNFSRFVCTWAQTLSERETKVQDWNFYYCFENTQSEIQNSLVPGFRSLKLTRFNRSNYALSTQGNIKVKRLLLTCNSTSRVFARITLNEFTSLLNYNQRSEYSSMIF